MSDKQHPGTILNAVKDSLRSAINGLKCDRIYENSETPTVHRRRNVAELLRVILEIAEDRFEIEAPFKKILDEANTIISDEAPLRIDLGEGRRRLALDSWTPEDLQEAGFEAFRLCNNRPWPCPNERDLPFRPISALTAEDMEWLLMPDAPFERHIELRA